jgi:hypothetical protein
MKRNLMKKNFLLLTILLPLVFGSCIDDITENTYTCEEEGEFLGEFLITPESNEYWAYGQTQKRVYLDSIGNELEMISRSSYLEIIQETQVRTVCGDWSTPIREVDVIKTEHKRAYYRNDNSSFFLSLESSAINITDDSEQIVDIMTVSAGNSYYNFVIDDRGNSNNIPNYLWKGNLETVSDTTFLGQQFNDVYYEDFYERPTFFNKTQGIVAFYDFNKTFYVLDRIE